MDELITFLRAREAERKRMANDIHHDDCASTPDAVAGGGECDCGVPEFVLADVAAKRQIIKRCEKVISSTRLEDLPVDNFADGALRLLSLPYVDHPDYRVEWRP